MSVKASKTLPLIILGGIIIISAALWFSGLYTKMFATNSSSQVNNTLALDLTTLQATIRAVSTPTIEELHFIEAIDTLSRAEDIQKLRNPFERVYIAPPPPPKSEETKKVSKKSSTTKSKPKPRKKRIVRPDVTVNGIIWDRSRPFAILDNEIYGVGDLIKGYTIQSIQDTMIFLANNDDQFTITIERE